MNNNYFNFYIDNYCQVKCTVVYNTIMRIRLTFLICNHVKRLYIYKTYVISSCCWLSSIKRLKLLFSLFQDQKKPYFNDFSQLYRQYL